MRLKSVVLPAPFGPISAVRVPTGTAKRMSCVTARPPKRLVTPSSVNAGSAATRASPKRQATDKSAGDDAFRTERHHQDDQDAENQVARRSTDAKQLRQHREEYRAGEWPPCRLRAADEDVEQDVDRQQRIEVLRLHEAEVERVERARQAGERTAYGECGDLHGANVDAHADRGVLVVVPRPHGQPQP